MSYNIIVWIKLMFFSQHAPKNNWILAFILWMPNDYSKSFKWIQKWVTFSCKIECFVLDLQVENVKIILFTKQKNKSNIKDNGDKNTRVIWEDHVLLI